MHDLLTRFLPFNLIESHSKAFSVHTPGVSVVFGQSEKFANCGHFSPSAAESLLIDLYDVHVEQVVLQIAERLSSRTVDESSIDGFLLTRLAVETYDANLPANVLHAQHMGAGMRRNRIHHTEVFFRHADMLLIFIGNIIRKQNGIPFILIGIAYSLIISFETIGDIVRQLIGYVRRPAVHFPCGKALERAKRNHGGAVPFAENFGLCLLKDFFVGNIQIDVRQAAAENSIS